MKTGNMKRKFAAVLAAVTLLSGSAPAALAEGLVTLITPPEGGLAAVLGAAGNAGGDAAAGLGSLTEGLSALGGASLEDVVSGGAAALDSIVPGSSEALGSLVSGLEGAGTSLQTYNAPGADAVTPGTGNGASIETYNSSGVESLTPGGGTDTGDSGSGGSDSLTFNEFTMSASATGTGITVTIAGGSAYEIEIKAKNTETGASKKDWIYEGAGSVSFELDPGTYTVTAGYVSNSYSRSDSVTVAAASSGTEGQGEGGGEAAYSAELTAITVTDTDEGESTGSITGKVTFTGDLDMVAKLYAAGSGEKIAEDTIAKGGDGSFSFTGLAAGEYTLNIYFYGKGNETPPVAKGCTVKSKTVTPDPDDVAPGDAVARFTLTAGQQNGEIYATIAGASNREIEIRLYDKDDAKVGETFTIGSDTAVIGSYAAGEYTVRAAYVTPSKDSDGNEIEAVTAAVTVPAGTEPPAQAEFKAIAAKVEKGEDYIIVTVTDAADQPMYLLVGSFDAKEIGIDSAVRFDKLSPGSYDIEVGYVATGHGISPFRTSVTLEEPDELAAIVISQVVGGENQLVVVGTAEPQTNVTFTTEPASTTTVIKTDAQGHFTAALTCEAGTYTKVTAQYGTDGESAVSFTGTFAVTAPAAKPTLTVDEVTEDSTTVAAKTTPGVVVEIKTSDYSQRVTADSEGLLHFSLPHTYEEGTKLTFTVYYGADNSESFTQTETVKEAESYKELEKGDKGDAVTRLTQRLKELGYPVSVTSKYSDSVVTAISLFQKANGLKVTGEANEKTQKALYSVGAIAYSDKIKYPTLVRGDRDMALIYTLQQRLKDLGYYTIKVDGIFGSGTQRAVRDFQRVNGLTVTGKADSATQTLLYSSAAKPAGYYGGDYKTLTRSSKYQSKVVPLQRRLKELGYYTGSIDGYFGSKTYRAVRNFQSRNGISVTGKADPYTQQVLYSADARKASGSSSSSSSSGYRLLYWGCEGSAVKRLQNALIDAGYKSIVRVADGIYGQWTYDAVRAYQKDHGLSVDGVAGKNTQNSLYGTNY